MARHAAKKTAEMMLGGTDRRGTRDAPPVQKPLPHPRRGNRLLLSASVVLFAVWLAILTWLAFS